MSIIGLERQPDGTIVTHNPTSDVDEVEGDAVEVVEATGIQGD